MRLLITIIFITLLFPQAGAQSKITLYYNDQGKLTIPALSSHYRIAEIDTISNEFNGRSLEFNVDSVLVRIYEYSHGQLENLTTISSQGDSINFNPKRLEKSLKSVIENKNSFSQAICIRKNDYRMILNRLSPIPMNSPIDSIMWEGKLVPGTEIYNS